MSYEWTEITRPGRRLAEHPAQFSREQLTGAMRRAVDALSAQQAPEGFWCGELTADTTLEADYIMLQLWLHQPDGDVWDPPSRPRIAKACNSILERQLPDGGFNIYHGGPAELNATVKAYCGL